MSLQSKTRERMWRSMRMLRRFDAPSIATTAEVKITTARTYIQILKDAGYLVVETQAKGGQAGSYTVYSLRRDSGPLYPKIDPCRLVYDQNTDTYYAPQSILERAKDALAGSTS